MDILRLSPNGSITDNPKLKADNRRRMQKANTFAESLRPTLTSFINSKYTQRQIVDELNRIGVKTANGCEFRLPTLQRILKRLNLSTVNSQAS